LNFALAQTHLESFKISLFGDVQFRNQFRMLNTVIYIVLVVFFGGELGGGV